MVIGCKLTHRGQSTGDGETIASFCAPGDDTRTFLERSRFPGELAHAYIVCPCFVYEQVLVRSTYSRTNGQCSERGTWDASHNTYAPHVTDQLTLLLALCAGLIKQSIHTGDCPCIVFSLLFFIILHCLFNMLFTHHFFRCVCLSLPLCVFASSRIRSPPVFNVINVLATSTLLHLFRNNRSSFSSLLFLSLFRLFSWFLLLDVQHERESKALGPLMSCFFKLVPLGRRRRRQWRRNE